MTGSMSIIAGLLIFATITIFGQLSWAGVSAPVSLVSDYGVVIATERASKDGYSRKWIS